MRFSKAVITTVAEYDSKRTVDNEGARLICEAILDTPEKIEAEGGHTGARMP